MFPRLVFAACLLYPAAGQSPLKYTAFLGGEAVIASIAAGPGGSAYVTGYANGALPTTPGALQTEYNPATCTAGQKPLRTFPCAVAFAGKLNSGGTAFEYLTYLRASNSSGSRIAVDAQGDAWIAGLVLSTDLPVTPGAPQSQPKGFSNVFVMKLNPEGSRILFATYLGGSDSQEPDALAVDANGNAYIAGSTSSSDFPVTPGAFQTSFISSAAFVTKLDASGKLMYSTYFQGGPSSATSITAIAADSNGAAYFTGTNLSGTLPVTAGAFQTTAQSASAAYVAKLDPTGSKLVYATYLSGNSDVQGTAVAVDSSGNALAAGSILLNRPNLLTSFPVTRGAFQTAPPQRAVQGGVSIAFIAKLNAAGSALVYSTLLYASEAVFVVGLRADAAGNAVAVGSTTALDFPVTAGALRQCNPRTSWGTIGFLFKLSADGSRPLYSTYLGTDPRSVVDIDADGNAYVAGSGLGPFPVIPGSFGWTGGGAYVLKLATTALPAGSVNCVANAASWTAGAIAPGEIVDILGVGIGPQRAVAASGVAASLGGVRVEFNGIAAPILYAGPDRIRAIVPFEVGPAGPENSGIATVQILGAGTPVQPAVAVTAASAPGIFTVDGSPEGQALAINEDGTINSEKNPSPQGSIVTLYATGLNQTKPALATGEIASGPAPLALPILIGSSSGMTEVVYAGAAPGFVAGLTQINFRVPVSIFHGFTLVGIQAGSHSSQTGVYFYMQ